MICIVWSVLRDISGWSAKEGRWQLRIRQNLLPSPRSSKVMEWAVVDLLPPAKSVAGPLIWLFIYIKQSMGLDTCRALQSSDFLGDAE